MSEKIETRGWRAGLGSRVAHSLAYGLVVWAAIALNHSDKGFTACWWVSWAYFIGWGEGREWLRTSLRKISQR